MHHPTSYAHKSGVSLMVRQRWAGEPELMLERSENKKGARVAKPDVGGDSKNELHPGVQTCEVCGNEYDKPLEIVMNGISHYFDSFECAIHALAPKCHHCGCRIIGHGHEASGVMFCCAHCAQHEGVGALKDRAN